MPRINVYEGHRLAGWFDPDKAVEVIPDTRRWDGNNMVSIVTNDRFARETLYRTPGGRWVLEYTSQWANTPTSYRFLCDEEARDWLLRDEDDDVVERYWGPLDDEAGPNLGGRPPIGGIVSTAVGTERLEQVDAWAQEQGLTRAEAIRRLLDAALEARAR